MIILSLDSAGSGCGVCLWRGGTVLADAYESMERGQDQRLMPLVEQVLKKGGAGYNDLDRIAVTRGPGSFTGIRIGLAAARGIGLSTGKPVIGIDRFAIYRLHVQPPNKSLLIAINSRREELFCRFYPVRGGSMETLTMTPPAIIAFTERKGDTVITGDMPVPGVADFHPLDEKETILAAALASAANPEDPIFLPRPLYIRPPDVTID